MASIYNATWEKSLKITSMISSLVFIIIAIYFYLSGNYAGTIIFLLFLFIPYLFIVKGYELNGSNLFIIRSFWKTKINLTGLKQIEISSGMIKHKTIRVFFSDGPDSHIIRASLTLT